MLRSIIAGRQLLGSGGSVFFGPSTKFTVKSTSWTYIASRVLGTRPHLCSCQSQNVPQPKRPLPERFWYEIKTTVSPYARLMRIDRPIGSWLLFWPCAWATGLATAPGCWPDLWLLALFGAGAFTMRGAGCTINDMWDRDIDAKVERTKSRPLVSGELSQTDALALLAVQLGVGCIILQNLNWYSVVLGASSLGLVVIYPLAKRVTYWPQLVLGMTFNWGALIGWSATQGAVNWSACLPLYAAGICWTIIYDTIYAHQDKVDDALLGIKSTALRFGDKTKLWLMGFSVAMTSGLTTCGLLCNQSWPYYASVALVTAHVVHQISTLNIHNPQDCAKKFISNHQVGLLLFVGILLGTLLQNAEKKTLPKPKIIHEKQQLSIQ
ncbi:4-hydroxybenzoate polyprenyltransferase, mitochondrial [Phlebotomus argentipes]|uniref:4-hydroxybenzoate polyprenyltransferase, mitochondrial n=1 Tax=Phlebotomus argentipes TaxID=94469 RepID=UPI002892B1CD|nr:4-hydroxybenzoate polyprenyltransferase, mitochondrial [Phlebotomus argentipes]